MPTDYLLTVAIMNVSTELVVLVITIPVLLKLRLPLREKSIIIGLFGLGVATVSDSRPDKGM